MASFLPAPFAGDRARLPNCFLPRGEFGLDKVVTHRRNVGRAQSCAERSFAQDDRYAIRIWFAKELHAEVNTLSLIVRVSQAAAAGLAQRLS